MGGQYCRNYVMIRALKGNAGGFARIEYRQGKLTVSIRIARLEKEHPPLRVLLLSGEAESGAATDLGLMTSAGDGRAVLRTELTVSAAAMRAFHTVAIAEDWPLAQVKLWGMLREAAGEHPVRMQEIVSRYLSMPPAGAAVQRKPERGETLFGLPRLRWSAELEGLRTYFDTLPPSSPFDAPGWRFVRVPLPSRRPAGWCEVGVRLHEHAVTTAVYALPGQYAANPPAELQGYSWIQGRNGQGYWVRLHQSGEACDDREMINRLR